MIAYLRGKILFRYDDGLIIEAAGGVGYRVFATKVTLSEILAKEEVALWIEHCCSREGIESLIGFKNKEEQTWFNFVRSVPGVGLKTALAVLSLLPPVNLCKTILGGDLSTLQLTEGLGKKIATRIITDLKDKASKWLAVRAIDCNPNSDFKNSKEEVMSALCSLGYEREKIFMVVDRIFRDTTTDELIKEALAILAADTLRKCNV